jgi:putative ATP-grasp target RiPP
MDAFVARTGDERETTCTTASATSDDTLVPVSSRFSLACAYPDLPFSDAPPTDAETRPFVLRVAGRPAAREAARLPQARYCHKRQIAVTADELALPLYPMAADRTTISSKDGKDNPQEDWKMDL